MLKYKYRKPYRIRKRKSIWRNRFFQLGVLILVAGCLLFYFFILSETFQIKKIVVSGEEKVSQQDLKALIEKNKSIFLINLNKLREKILSKFPRISEAEISRNFPDTLNIFVVERKGIASFCQNDQCFLLDKEGVIFEKALPESNLLKIIEERKKDNFSLGKRVIEKEMLKQILEIEKNFRENLKILIQEASIPSNNRLNIKTQEGWKVYFNLKKDLAWQLTKLRLLLEQRIPPQKRKNIEYIDLRFQRAYIYPETYRD